MMESRKKSGSTRTWSVLEVTLVLPSTVLTRLVRFVIRLERRCCTLSPWSALSHSLSARHKSATSRLRLVASVFLRNSSCGSGTTVPPLPVGRSTKRNSAPTRDRLSACLTQGIEDPLTRVQSIQEAETVHSTNKSVTVQKNARSHLFDSMWLFTSSATTSSKCASPCSFLVNLCRMSQSLRQEDWAPVEASS